MHLIGSTILAWLNLAGWLMVSVVLWGYRGAVFTDDMGMAVCFVAFAVWLTVCAVAAFCYTMRCHMVMRCCANPRYVARLALDLEAKERSLKERHFALQTLADYVALGFSPSAWVRFLPSAWVRCWRFKTTPDWLKKGLEVEAIEPPKKETGPILEPLRRGFADTLERLSDAIEGTIIDWPPDDADNAAPAEVPLPPLHAEQFVETLRGPFEIVLSSLAETINAAPDARAVLESRERGQELFGGFLDEALELGLKLRVDAAVAELPVLNASSSEWHAADPELRGPTRSWVEKYRRMKADESNLF